MDTKSLPTFGLSGSALWEPRKGHGVAFAEAEGLMD